MLYCQGCNREVNESDLWDSHSDRHAVIITGDGDIDWCGPVVNIDLRVYPKEERKEMNETNKAFWIVWCEGGIQDIIPKCHSRKEVDVSAKEMALKSPGREFIVLRAMHSYKMPFAPRLIETDFVAGTDDTK